MNVPAFVIFVAFILLTLAITAWAARRTRSLGDFYTAGGKVTGFQNGLAFAGDFLSAAALLGVAGLYFTAGMDGLIYGLGALVGCPVLLFLLSERLRRLGKFTLTDVMATKIDERPARIFSGAANLTVLVFYMVSQLVGAGLLVNLLAGISFGWSTLLVSVLMVVYVFFGGMVAATWVQIIKAGLLIVAAAGLTALVMARFDFNLGAVFDAAVSVGGEKVMQPGALVTGVGGALSLGLALMFGPAGLPHVLMRFFTVPDATEARRSALVATLLISVFCLFMLVIGYGSIALLNGDARYVVDGALKGGSNMAALHLAQSLGGDILLGFIAAVAFATILAVVSGITIAAAATVSHDLYGAVTRSTPTEAQELKISRIATVVFALISIALSFAFKDQNITFLSATAFSIAASATFPVLALCLFWKPVTTRGAVSGGVAGLASAVIALILGPSIWVSVLGNAEPIYPHQYPTLLSMPLAFGVAVIVSLLDRQPAAVAAGREA